jgi:hypothetical protein
VTGEGKGMKRRIFGEVETMEKKERNGRIDSGWRARKQGENGGKRQKAGIGVDKRKGGVEGGREWGAVGEGREGGCRGGEGGGV